MESNNNQSNAATPTDNMVVVGQNELNAVHNKIKANTNRLLGLVLQIEQFNEEYSR